MVIRLYLPTWRSNCPHRIVKRTPPSLTFARTVAGKTTSPLPLQPARTRFAPSPTGHLHLGSLRTALFNFLLARKTGGQFILRLEDTDQKRTVPGAEQRLYEDLKWAGLNWDEGPHVGGSYGPYKQSQRTSLYHHHAAKLIESGNAYRCFCAPERLFELAEQRSKLGVPTDYDRRCAAISQSQSEQRAAGGESHVIRLRAPDVYPEFADLIYGRMRPGSLQQQRSHVENAYDDPILLKSDGMPTYHLANVVDDHLMDITHVIRGTEWLSATLKHMALYAAFGWKPPAYAHVGLLMNEEGNKLSKRNLDLDIAYFRGHMDILPQALTNFVALLGWSHTRKSDVMTLEELIDAFTLKFTKGNARVTLEKLHYLQKQHLGRLAGALDSSLLESLVRELETKYSLESMVQILQGRSLRDYAAAVLQADAKNYSNPSEFAARNSYFFISEQSSAPDRAALDQLGLTELEIGHICQSLAKIPRENWKRDTIGEEISRIVTSTAVKQVQALSDGEGEAVQKRASAAKSRLNKYLRAAIAYGRPGPGMSETMAILGQDVSLQRLRESVQNYEGEIMPK